MDTPLEAALVFMGALNLAATAVLAAVVWQSHRTWGALLLAVRNSRRR